MKTLPLSLLFVFWVWSAGAWASERYTLEVDGLACPFCAYGVEKRLYAVDGVQSVETDIKSGVVIVTVEDGKPLTEAVAKKAVKDAGFTLRTFRKGGSSE